MAGLNELTTISIISIHRLDVFVMFFFLFNCIVFVDEFELPVSLEYMIGGGKLLSLKCRCLGYLVLLNKCRTKQMSPAKTAIPVETPNSVGKSDVSVDMSGENGKIEKSP